MSQFLWKIGGEAGFGITTIGLSFSQLASRSGYYVFDYNEYPSLIRGGHNTYEVNVSNDPIFASKNIVDLLICLNKETYVLHKHRLGPESLVVYDAQDFEITEDIRKINVPFKHIKNTHEVMQIMINTVAIGASLGLMGGDINIFSQIIEQEFMRKGQEVVDFNIKFANIGYDHVKTNYPSFIKPVLAKKSDSQEKVVATGNDIFSLGAVTADCRLYCAYPMTPSSTVLTTLAAWQEESGMIVRHAEDEIAVVSTALGASFAGVRSAVGTSGGGYALMTESVSYAGVAEIPLVLFMSMRPGPATGMPTWTDQGDLLFVVHGGHGEFPKIVLSPGDINEMMHMTLLAFDMADIYQTPVIVLSDKFLSESHQTFEKKVFDDYIRNYKVNRGKLIEQAEGNYLRYKVTDDGISDRLVPGAKGHFYQANSYEHVEDGHTTEDAAVRIRQADKRTRKWDMYLKDHFKGPEIIGSIEEAEICFVSWGSNKGPIVEAMKELTAKGRKTAFVHFTYIYPMNRQIVEAAIPKNKRLILIEKKSHAQFGKLLQMEASIEIKEKILKYDGRPFYPEEIVNHVLNH